MYGDDVGVCYGCYSVVDEFLVYICVVFEVKMGFCDLFFCVVGFFLLFYICVVVVGFGVYDLIEFVVVWEMGVCGVVVEGEL